MLRIYPFSLLRDFLAFHGALFLRKAYEPLCTSKASNQKPTRDYWYTYYSTCVTYITSLHNQFVAVLSIQGALAIGCLAAIELLAAKGVLVPILGAAIAATELGLMIVAMKLFR